MRVAYNGKGADLRSRSHCHAGLEDAELQLSQEGPYRVDWAAGSVEFSQGPLQAGCTTEVCGKGNVC